MDKKILEFLNKIAKMESDSGRNINHEVVSSGPQKGQHAVGSYGLLPVTIKDVIKRAQLQGNMPTDWKQFDNLTDDQIRNKILERPDLENQIAQSLAGRVLTKQHNDPNRAAYAWNHGTNLSYLPDDRLEDDQYANKFKHLKNQLQPQQIPQLQEDNTMIPLEAKNLMDKKAVAEDNSTMASDPNNDLDSQLANQLLSSSSSSDEDEDKNERWKQMAALLKG